MRLVHWRLDALGHCDRVIGSLQVPTGTAPRICAKPARGS